MSIWMVSDLGYYEQCWISPCTHAGGHLQDIPQEGIGSDWLIMSIPGHGHGSGAPKLEPVGEFFPSESGGRYHGLWLHQNYIFKWRKNIPKRQMDTFCIPGFLALSIIDIWSCLILCYYSTMYSGGWNCASLRTTGKTISFYHKIFLLWKIKLTGSEMKDKFRSRATSLCIIGKNNVVFEGDSLSKMGAKI